MNRDAALYALGVGVCLSDAVDGVELKYVYHENGQGSIKVSFFFFFFNFSQLVIHTELVRNIWSEFNFSKALSVINSQT